MDTAMTTWAGCENWIFSKKKKAFARTWTKRTSSHTFMEEAGLFASVIGEGEKHFVSKKKTRDEVPRQGPQLQDP